MKVGVISDTHISPLPNERYLLEKNVVSDPEYLCDILSPYFKDVDCILHAGDFTHVSVMESLERGVRGEGIARKTFNIT